MTVKDIPSAFFNVLSRLEGLQRGEEAEIIRVVCQRRDRTS